MSAILSQQSQGLARDRRSTINLLRPRQDRTFTYVKSSRYRVSQKDPQRGFSTPSEQRTELHEQHLDVEWVELPPCNKPQPAVTPGTLPSRGDMSPSKTIETLCKELTNVLQPDTEPWNSLDAIKTVVNTLWPSVFNMPHDSHTLHLRFGGHFYVNAVEAQIAWDLPLQDTRSYNTPSTPVSMQHTGPFGVATQPWSGQEPAAHSMIAYIDKNQLASVRSNDLFGVETGAQGQQNELVIRLQEVADGKLSPKNSDHDAYLLAVLLGMARKHFYLPPPITDRYESIIIHEADISPFQDFHDLKLRILTRNVGTSEFIVYTGHVTKEALNKFQDPFTARPNNNTTVLPKIRIKYTRVPIWPILGRYLCYL